MLEQINCNLCGIDDTKLLYNKDSLNIVRCKRCSLVYINPRLSEADREKYYSKDYFNVYFKDKEIHMKNRFKKRLDEIYRYKEGGRLLEIGCGTGFFLALARKRGWETYGAELSPYASRYACEELKLNVFKGRLEKANYPKDYFDVITLWHILEHVPDPEYLLKEIARILKSDGLLAIEVPNISSLVVRLLKTKWELFAPKEHLYYFSPKTLGRMLKEMGFKIIKMHTYFWTSPDMIIKSLLFFSWIRFKKLYSIIKGDVMVIYAKKEIKEE